MGEGNTLKVMSTMPSTLYAFNPSYSSSLTAVMEYKAVE